MGQKRLRAVVVEEAYAVVARIVPEEPESFRSDEVAAAMRISEVLRARGRRPEMVTADEGVFVSVFLGDEAEEAEYEEAAGELLEAASW